MICTELRRLVRALTLLVLCFVGSPAVADSGTIFYFALPGNSLGRERSSNDLDHQRSVYHLVVERAPDPLTGDKSGGPAPFKLEFMYGGRAYTYGYEWTLNSTSGEWEQNIVFDGDSMNSASVVDYGAPVGIELETLYDPDDPSGPLPEVLTSTNDSPYGGVQDGVFRLTSDEPVRLLLYNVDGPYVDPEVDTFAPAYHYYSDQVLPDEPSTRVYPERYMGVPIEAWPHYANGQWSPDVTRIYPVNNLGNEYTLNIDVPDRQVRDSRPKASVTVVATRDNTRLSFGASPLMLGGDEDGDPVPVPSSVTLNRGQMWTLSADQYRLSMLEFEGVVGVTDPIPPYYIDSAINLFNGMKINATKPVAVITAGGCATVRRSACDQTLNQLLPDRSQGTLYHVPIMPRSWADGFDVRIVAVEDLTQLEVVVKVPSISPYNMDDGVEGQPDWTTLGVQAFDLLDLDTEGTGFVEAGTAYECVWTSLAHLGTPALSAERPGYDKDNRRLTLANIVDDGNDGLLPDWAQRLIAESSSGLLPSGTFRLENGNDTAPAVMTIRSDAKISVQISPKIWSKNAGAAFRLPGDGSVESMGGKVGAGASQPLSQPPTGPAGFPYEYFWDSICGYAATNTSDNSGDYYGVGPVSTYQFTSGSPYTEEVGIFADPAVASLAPVDNYMPFVSVSVPVALSSEYLTQPRSYVNYFGEVISGYNLPFSHFIMLVVHDEYVNGSSEIGIRRVYNCAINTSSDTDWYPFSSELDSGVNSGGFVAQSQLLTLSAVCREAFMEEAFDFINNELLPQAFNPNDGGLGEYPPLVFKHTDWIALPQDPNSTDTYHAIVLRVIPFKPEDLQSIMWGTGDRAARVSTPFDDPNDGSVNDIMQGDFVPDIPSVSYEFAVGTGMPGTPGFSVDTNAKALAAYSLGVGFYGSYLATAGIPAEPTPEDQLSLVDQIAVAPGNTIDPASVRLVDDNGGTVPLVLNEDFSIDEYNGEESILLSVDLSDQTIMPGETVELQYDLELRDVTPGESRLVGESTELEFFTYAPGASQQNTQERGPTTLEIGDGPVQLSVVLENSSGQPLPSENIMYVAPDADINTHAVLSYDTDLDAYRQVIGDRAEFGRSEHVFANTRLIEDGVSGHDQYRDSSVMLSRTGVSSTVDFHTSGTFTLIFDAGRPVDWGRLIIHEGELQPQEVNGPVDVDVVVDLVTKVEVRNADSLAQIMGWRDEFASSAPAFIEATGESIDGLPTTTDDPVSLGGVPGLTSSSLLEVRVTLARGESLTDGKGVSPVIESVIAAYSPSDVRLELDVLDADDQVVYELLRSQQQYGIPENADIYAAMLSGELFPHAGYRVRGRLIDVLVGDPIVEAFSDPFEVLLPTDASGILAGNITTDRPSYRVGDSVRITSDVSNISDVPWTDDLMVFVDVYWDDDSGIDFCSDPGGAIVTYSSVVYGVDPGGTDTREYAYLVSNLDEPGNYKVVQRVHDEVSSSTPLLCTVTEFTVRPDDSTTSIAGFLDVTPRQLPDSNNSGTATLSYRIVNEGNVDLTDLEIQIYAEHLTTPASSGTVLDPTEIGTLERGGGLWEDSLEWIPSNIGTFLIHLRYSFTSIPAGDPDRWTDLAVGTLINDNLNVVPEQPWYVAIELEPLPGSPALDELSKLGVDDYRGAINERGVVVGWGESDLNPDEAYARVWFDCVSPVDLHAAIQGAVSGSTIDSSYATDISDDGTIVGVFVDSTDKTRAFIHSEHVGSHELKAIGSPDSVVATAVNSLGRDSSAVGWKETGSVSTGVLWRRVYQLDRAPGFIVEPFPLLISGQDIVSSRLVDINDEGIAVGWYETNLGEYKMLWVGSNDVVHTMDGSIELPVGSTTTDIRLYSISDREQSGIGMTRKVYGTYIYNDAGTLYEVPFYANLSTSRSSQTGSVAGIGRLIAMEGGFTESHIRPIGSTTGLTTVGSMGNNSSLGTAFLWDGRGSIGYEIDELILNEDVMPSEWEVHSAVSISSFDGSIAAVGTHNSTDTALKIERIPLSNEDIDSLHFWIRPDTGVVTDAVDTLTDWHDLTRGGFKDGDLDTENPVTITGTPMFMDDCCDTSQVLLTPGDSIQVDLLKDDAGNPIASEGSLSVVFTASPIDPDVPANSLGAPFLQVGSGEYVLTAAIDVDNKIFVFTKSHPAGGQCMQDSVLLGKVFPGEPALLTLRQQSNGMFEVWLNQDESVELPTSQQLDWSTVSVYSKDASDFVEYCSSAPDDLAGSPYGLYGVHIGLAELMVFDRALSDESIEAVGDMLRRRHDIGAAMMHPDAMLWLRSDRGADPNNPVAIWQDQYSVLGDFTQASSSQMPEVVSSWFEQCIPALQFDGDDFLVGLGPADVLLVLDHSASMDDPETSLTLENPALCVDQFENGVQEPFPSNGDITDSIWAHRFPFTRDSADQFAELMFRDGAPLGTRMGLMHSSGLDFPGTNNQIELLDLSGIDGADPIERFTDIESVYRAALCAWSSQNVGIRDWFHHDYDAGDGQVDNQEWWINAPDDVNLAHEGLGVIDSILSGTALNPAVVPGTPFVNSSHRKAAIMFTDSRLVDRRPDLYDPDPDLSEVNYLIRFDELFMGTNTNYPSYDITDEIASLRANQIPYYTVGIDLMPFGSRIHHWLSNGAAHGGYYQSSLDQPGLSNFYEGLASILSGVVEQGTVALTFRANNIPSESQPPSVLLQAGSLTGEVREGINVWLQDQQMHVGIWWTGSGGTLEYSALSAPVYELTGIQQLVVTFNTIPGGGFAIEAYQNGLQMFAPSGGVPGSESKTIFVENEAFFLGDMSLGGSPTSEARTDGGDTLSSASGFVGELYEVALFHSNLNGVELARLFDWGRDRYGAGTLTQGYAPIAIAQGGGVGSNAYFDTNYDGVETVILSASQSYDPDDLASSLRYRWYIGDQLVGSGDQITTSLSRGRHRVRLEVEDPAGHVALDELLVDVNRVHQHIKPVDIPFDHGPLQGVGDPLPFVLDISAETDSKLHLRGDVPTYQTGRKASSVKLDGSSLLDLSEARDEIPAGSNPRTYSIWFETGVTDHDDPSLFVQSSDTGHGTFEITGNRRRVAYRVDGYTRGVEWTDPADQLPVGWHHLAVVVPRGALWSDQVRMYLNGEELFTTRLDGSGPAGPLNSGSDQIYIGGNPLIEGGVTKYQGGRVDEAQVFSGALSPSEVHDLYNEVPVAAWGFESASSSYAYASTQIIPTDISTLVLSEHFAMINSAGRLALGKKGGATTAGAVFDAPQGNWTIMFKIQPEAMTADLDPLISDSTGAVLMLLEDPNEVPLLYVATADNSREAPTLFDGQEHWVTIVSRKGYPGVTDGTFVFVDADIDFTSPLDASSTILDGGPITIAGPNGNNGGYEGTIDDFHIFDRPLTEQECLDVMND